MARIAIDPDSPDIFGDELELLVTNNSMASLPFTVGDLWYAARGATLVDRVN